MSYYRHVLSLSVKKTGCADFITIVLVLYVFCGRTWQQADVSEPDGPLRQWEPQPPAIQREWIKQTVIERVGECQCPVYVKNASLKDTV